MYVHMWVQGEQRTRERECIRVCRGRGRCLSYGFFWGTVPGKQTNKNCIIKFLMQHTLFRTFW